MNLRAHCVLGPAQRERDLVLVVVATNDDFSFVRQAGKPFVKKMVTTLWVAVGREIASMNEHITSGDFEIVLEAVCI